MPTLAFAQQSYYGTTASSIRLSEGANPSDLDRIPIRVGDVISPENVRAGIKALFDTGLYRSVEVDAVASANGTDLTFKVTPHYFFATFALKPDNLVERPLSTLLRLPVGQKYSDTRVQEITTEAQQLLEDEGYFGSTLTTMLGPDNPERLRSVYLLSDRTVKDRAKIGEIEIQGAGDIFPISELKKTLHVSDGEFYSATNIDRGVSAIRKKFLDRNFLNTQVETSHEYNAATNTVRLLVTIQPGQETVIDTAGQIPDDDIHNLVPIFEEGQLDPDLIREGRARMIEYLQQKGYFDAVVDGPDIVPASAGNPTRVVFSIKLGEQHKVKSVQFRGNQVFKEEDFESRIRIHPAAFLSHGLFSDELAKADAATIQNMYRRAGYEAAIVEVHSEENPLKDEIDVIFNITENKRFKIERLVFEGNTMPEADLRAAGGVKEGDFYSPAAAENARTALRRLYYKLGYPDVQVDATADRNPETGDKLLTYRISEGRQYRIGAVLVTGNTRTTDKFIRRTSKLEEYKSWFNPEDILEAQRQLYATGLFRHVDVVPLDVDTGEVRTILIQVEEAKPILFTPGVGVKEYAGPRLTLDVSHNNLFGGNRSLGVRLRVGVHEQQFQTTYHEPRLFNHETLDGFGTLTIETTNRPLYATSGTELSLQIRKKVSNTKSFLTTASYQNVNLTDIKINPVVDQFFKDLQGVIQIARLGESFISDRRDDAVDPTRGVFTTSTFQIANKAFGSEVNFVSLYNQTTYQKKERTAVVAMSSRVGWKVPYGVTPEVPITERYFAGGSTTLRGFGLDEAGPPAGGQLLAIGNVEYRVPLKTYSFGSLGAAAFYDTGNVFERPSNFSFRDFTHTAGLGVRFLTPLGPVRFDVGFNLHPRLRLNADGLLEREGRTHFFLTLGHPF